MCSFLYIISVEQIFLYICTAGGLAGIAAVLTVWVNHAKYKRDNHLDALVARIEAMQTSFDSQLKAMQTNSDAQLKAMQAESKIQTDAFRAQIQAMQTGFDSQLNSWKSLWEASTQEIRELKMEIKELRVENDKLRTEVLELKGQLKEHYKLA